MRSRSADGAGAQEFAGKLFGQVSATLAVVLAALGDRLGLFKDLAKRGPATAGGLAERTGLDERYVREWLNAMASAGYLGYKADGAYFYLPPDHAPALAEEANPLFLGGLCQEVPFLIGALDRVEQAFWEGSGVPLADYDPRLWVERRRDGARRPDRWVGGLPEAQGRLGRGGNAADIACGNGQTLIGLAWAFPRARLAGYDSFRPHVARAMALAQAEGLADRVCFQHLDVAERGLPESFDLILAFDVLPSAPDPAGLLRAARQGLKPGGTCVIREYDVAGRLEENAGAQGAYVYSLSVLFGLPTALARQGEGFGAAGLAESQIRELAAEAGFGLVRRLPVADALKAYYELRL